VDWIADILLEHIKKVVAVHDRCIQVDRSEDDIRYIAEDGKICMDEVQEAIQMPKFDPRVAEAAFESRNLEVPDQIAEQLREYVSLIADAYRNNPFHNFEVRTMILGFSWRRITTRKLTSLYLLLLCLARMSCNNECQ